MYSKLVARVTEPLHAEEFKAWSQNLGHEEVLTTFYSYGDVIDYRQAELLKSLAQPRTEATSDMKELIQQTLMKMLGK